MSHLPKPTRFANYPGNVVSDIIGQIVGPNLLGERLTAVTADYDATTNKTRVGFTFQTVAATS